MKKNLLISVFTVFALMLSVNTFAQEKATKKDYKTMAKQEKVLNSELKKKALKDARKEAKKFIFFLIERAEIIFVIFKKWSTVIGRLYCIPV